MVTFLFPRSLSARIAWLIFAPCQNSVAAIWASQDRPGPKRRKKHRTVVSSFFSKLYQFRKKQQTNKTLFSVKINLWEATRATPRSEKKSEHYLIWYNLIYSNINQLNLIHVHQKSIKILKTYITFNTNAIKCYKML